MDIEDTIEGTLDGGEVSFFQYLLPTSGMTLRLRTQQGRVVLYADDTIQNPNAAFYDYKLETGGSDDVYIDPGAFGIGIGRRRRQASNNSIDSGFTDTTIYVSVEGMEGSNSFELETTFGNTCKFVYAQCSFRV